MSRRRVGCLVLAVVGWVVWVWWSGYLDGWNVVPPVRGVVVDLGTGEPVVGARVWRWWVKDEVGAARLSPGGYNTGYPSGAVETVTGEGGRFELSGYVGLHAVRGMGFLVYRPGYRVGWYEGGVEGRNSRVQVWVEGGRLRVEVRLERLDDLDPRRWEGHLATMAYGTEYGYPLPEDLLLDEAYRYVSQGGELTEGMAALLQDFLPSSPCPTMFCQDRRTVCTAAALLRYCESHTESAVCWTAERYVPYLRRYVESEGGCDAR